MHTLATAEADMVIRTRDRDSDVTLDPMGDESKPVDEAILEAIRRGISEARFPFVVVERRDDEALLAEMRKLLAEHTDVGRCRFSDDGAGTVLRALTGGIVTGRKEPLRDLRLWLRDARRLIIADPYFMHGDTTGWGGLSDPDKVQRAEAYAHEVKQVIGAVEDVRVYHLPSVPKEMQTALKRIAFDGRRFTPYETTQIHDRVWIKDGSDARVVGTSFGGIGNKLAFIIPLPEDDRLSFQEELRRIADE